MAMKARLQGSARNYQIRGAIWGTGLLYLSRLRSHSPHGPSFESILMGSLGRRYDVARSTWCGKGASKLYTRHLSGKARTPAHDGIDARSFNTATTTTRSSTLSSSDGLRSPKVTLRA